MQRLSIRLPNASTVFLCCVVPCGGLHDPLRLAGLAHFTEHMVARNARLLGDKYSLEYEAAMRFGSWLDAYTTLVDTCFEVEILPEYYHEARDWLEQVVTALPFDEVDWHLEQRVLWLQIRNREYTYDSERLLRRLIYGSRSRPARLLSGTVRTLRRTTSGDIRRFWRKHYRPEQMFLLEVGALPDGADPESLALLDKGNHFLTRELHSGVPPRGPIVHHTPRQRNTLTLDMAFLLPEEFARQPEQLFNALLLYRILDMKMMQYLRHWRGDISETEIGIGTYPLRIYVETEAIGGGEKSLEIVEQALAAARDCQSPPVEEVTTSARLALRYLHSVQDCAYRFGQHLLTPTGIFWADELQFLQRLLESPEVYSERFRATAQQIIQPNRLVLLLSGLVSRKEQTAIREMAARME